MADPTPGEESSKAMNSKTAHRPGTIPDSVWEQAGLEPPVAAPTTNVMPMKDGRFKVYPASGAPFIAERLQMAPDLSAALYPEGADHECR